MLYSLSSASGFSVAISIQIVSSSVMFLIIPNKIIFLSDLQLTTLHAHYQLLSVSYLLDMLASGILHV